MTNFEVGNCLESMTILVDTREQSTERAKRRYKSFPCPYRKQALKYGDYSYSFILPGGKEFLEPSPHEVTVPIAVERKMNLDELAGCFTKGRKRFEQEFVSAKENNARIYLLVEESSWEKLLAGKYRSRLNVNAYLSSVIAWQIRYNLQLLMCKEETTPVLIYEILKRDLKERLENGAFDNWEGGWN